MPTMIDETWDILELVFAERQRQEEKWGVQAHSPLEWYCIEGEEFGEVGREVFENNWGTTPHLIDEWIQVAAVAVAAIEDLLGNLGQTPAEYLNELNVTGR